MTRAIIASQTLARARTRAPGLTAVCLSLLRACTFAGLILFCFLPLTQAQSALTPLQREIEKQRGRLASNDVEERREALTRLGAMHRPEAARAAVPRLQDPEIIIRVTAAHAILSLPADEAAALLLPLLNDRKEFVRREAAYALGETRSRTAVDSLLTALARDKEAGVRGAAAVALGQIGDARAVTALTEALARRLPGSGVLKRITRATTDENDFVRRAAVEALGRIGDRASVPALIAVLTNEHAGDDVRREAVRALGLIGDPAAVPALRSVLAAADPYLSRLAYEVLRKLDPNNAARPA
ncbi:MAG: HEAT repeat domain-containing protein [Pyrinomonadaceae bacterium]